LKKKKLENEKIKIKTERRKKNPKNTENEITKKIEIEEKREEGDTLL
jgi:hypothetical protein